MSGIQNKTTVIKYAYIQAYTHVCIIVCINGYAHIVLHTYLLYVTQEVSA